MYKETAVMNLEQSDKRRIMHEARGSNSKTQQNTVPIRKRTATPNKSETVNRNAANKTAAHTDRNTVPDRRAAQRAADQTAETKREVKTQNTSKVRVGSASQGAVRLTREERERLLREEQKRVRARRKARLDYILSLFVIFAAAFAIFAALFAGVFFFSLTSHTSPDERSYTLELSDYENKLEVEEGSVIGENGERYVNFSQIAEFYDFAMVGSINDMKYVVKSSENETVSFAPDSDKAYVNGVVVRMDGPAFYEDGDLYVSESFVEKYVLGFTFETDKKTRTVSIKRELVNVVDAEGKIADGRDPEYESISFMLKAPAVTASISENDSAVVMPTFEFNANVNVYEKYMNPGSTTEFLTLVNDTHKLSEDYIPTGLSLLGYGDGMYLKEYAAKSFEAMMKEASACGISGLTVTKAYVSYTEALDEYNAVVEDYVNLLGNEQAKRYAAATVSLPGCDEHQTGLAVDIALTSTSEFSTSTAYAWLCDNSYKFGFVLRYPADKTDETGHVFKSEQFRYVGRYHAVRMNALGLSLDEYAEYLGV